MSAQEPTAGFVDVDLSFRALRRSRGALLAGLLVGLVVAGLFAFSQPDTHRSWATVLVRPIGVDLARQQTESIDAVAERELGASFIVAERAASKVGIDTTDIDAVRTLRRKTDVRTIDSRPVLEFSYADTDAGYARDVASAVAEAYLEVRLEQAESSIQDGITTLNERETSLQAQLAETEESIATARVDSAEYRAGINTQGVLISQLTSLGTDIARLESLARDPGRIISPAQLSQSTARGRTVPIMVAGAVLGAMLGVLAAIFRAQQKRTEHVDESGLADLGLPAIGHIPLGVGGVDVYSSLRRSLEQLVTTDTKVIGVTTIAETGPPTLVATSLAMSLGTDHRVLLVAADFDSRPVTGQLGLDEAPGLLDALVKGKSIGETRQRYGLIDVIGAGDTEGDPEAVLQLVGLSRFLNPGRTEYDYILVNAPGVTTSTTAHLATFAADGTLLVLDESEAKESIEEAASVLRRSGSDLLGSIVLTDQGPNSNK